MTSPAWLDGGTARARSGLIFGGVSRVVTTLGVFDFEPESRRMRLIAVHPGITPEAVQANTGFEILVGRELATTEPPTEKELGILRMLDPKRQFIG